VRTIGIFGRRYCFLLLICLLAEAALVRAQTRTPQEPPKIDDVVRVNTELVQTDVMVFDKQGRFVDGLKPEQFALKIDKKEQPIFSVDRVASGSKPETAGVPENPNSVRPNPLLSKLLGRTVIFFIDDLHLAPDSLSRTRKALLEFIERGMATRDLVAITSSSGQIGFLQQLTDDKVALRSAVARLNYRAVTKTDMDNPPMSEYIALKIREGDESTISFYVQEMMKQNCFRAAPGGSYICTVSTMAARHLVIERAQEIVTQTAPATDNTLILLEGLMRTAGQLAGRKLVFFISDGFYLNDKKAGSLNRIKRITDSAGRAGVIIYTLDARGIISESLDVTNNRPIDSEGLTVGSTIGEISASQDGLNALAKDTGGRALRNTNMPMSEWVDKVLDETADYYLLAWRPDSEDQKRGKLKSMELSIVGRPDLIVRLRRGYFKTAPLPLLTTRKKSAKDPNQIREEDMRLVIDAPISQAQIPTDLDLQMQQMPGVGTMVTATIEVSRQALTFELNDGKSSADVEIGGIFYDDKGKPIRSFVGRLRVFPLPEGVSEGSKTRAVYSFTAWLGSGLYQVRVGVRDAASGRIGSAMQWITVPKI